MQSTCISTFPGIKFEARSEALAGQIVTKPTASESLIQCDDRMSQGFARRTTPSGSQICEVKVKLRLKKTRGGYPLPSPMRCTKDPL